MTTEEETTEDMITRIVAMHCKEACATIEASKHLDKIEKEIALLLVNHQAKSFAQYLTDQSAGRKPSEKTLKNVIGWYFSGICDGLIMGVDAIGGTIKDLANLKALVNEETKT